jgi:Right handed beta helix region/FG-GAP-like repeat
MKTKSNFGGYVVRAAACAVLLLIGTNAPAATLTVTNANDHSAGSLRQAILDASVGDTINFAPNVTVINLTSNFLLINKNLTITGSGAHHLVVQRSGATGFEIFHVSPATVTATISGLTISNGSSSPSGTAGVYNNGATVTISDCVISNNPGGGILSTGSLTVSNSTISNNPSGLGGNGAGINSSGTTTITNCTIANNAAAGGGGIYNESSGIMTITSSTISGNSGTGLGGGIYNHFGTINLSSTLVALNSAPSGPDGYGAFVSQGHNLIGKRDGTTGFVQPTDQTGSIASPLDPKLDPAGLLGNGGPTQTIALLANSPAINHGNSAAPPQDQRGYGRAGVPDVGAFEFAGAAPAGPRCDFNGDDKPDYVLYNSSTGRTAIWYLYDYAYQSSAFGPTLPAGWVLVDVADFNGDGHPDYALFNPSTRATAIWYLNNNAYLGGAYGPTLPSGWTLVAVGDFNGDGHPDYVLYKASTHETSIWYLSNNVYLSAGSGPNLPVGWQIVGTADFNSDGHADCLLFNPNSRQSVIWYMFGSTRIGTLYGPPIASGYQLMGAADFNGDGKPDYVLFNASTRQTAIWYMNNNVFVSGAYGPTLPAGWSLVAP